MVKQDAPFISLQNEYPNASDKAAAAAASAANAATSAATALAITTNSAYAGILINKQTARHFCDRYSTNQEIYTSNASGRILFY